MTSYRVRAGVLTALLGAAGLGLGGLGLGSSAAATPSAPSAPSATAQPPLPGCTAEDLDVVLGKVVPQSRVSQAAIQITAKPGVRCTLPGESPTGMQFRDAAGEPLPTYPNPGGEGSPVVLAPDSPAHVTIGWMAYPFGPPVRPSSLSFTLPGLTSANSVAWPENTDVYRYGQIDYGVVTPGKGYEGGPYPGV